MADYQKHSQSVGSNRPGTLTPPVNYTNKECRVIKPVGQTLFLGASIVSATFNLGWGSTASSATVELIEDYQPCNACYRNRCTESTETLPGHNGSNPIRQFSVAGSYEDNHYYDCCPEGFDCPNSCYIDEFGNPYNPDRTKTVEDTTIPDPPTEKNVPGKLYYVWTNRGLVSRYWYDEDPGFFATGTKINPDGTLNSRAVNVYNIINTPVCLKFDNLLFVGIIKSWDVNFVNGRNSYRIEIESVSSLLRNSWMIVDGYAGAVFSYLNTYSYGSPRNYTGTGPFSTGTVESGNIHNVFNVYGFLESLGPYGFGGAYKNDRGISYRKLIQALKILTSSTYVGDLYWKSKNMFSPFGRIIGKVMERINTPPIAPGIPLTITQEYTTITPGFKNHAFGVIPPRYDATGNPRIEFTLDLSEIIIPPDDIRYDTSNKVVRVSDFIQNIVEKNGQQSYWITGNCVVQPDGIPFNIIKLQAVRRDAYIQPYTISSAIKRLTDRGYSVTTASSGQSRNEESKVRVLHLGGNQQRLYQAKNYRLAFNQHNFVWDPVNNKFLNYRRFDSSEKDKGKVPVGFVTRNPAINAVVNPHTYGAIYTQDELLRTLVVGGVFFDSDITWQDKQLPNGAPLKSTVTNCIRVYRNKDFDVDPNTGKAYSTVYRNNTPYNLVGNYEVFYTNDTTPYLRPADSSPKPSTAANRDQPDRVNASPSNPVTRPTRSPISPQIGRFIPLFRDILCPFFGFKYERSYPVTGDSNVYREIRPVWMDTWTGQICATFDIAELPPVSCGPLVSLYNKGVVTRDAVAGQLNNNALGLGDPDATTQTNQPINANNQTIPQPPNPPSPPGQNTVPGGAPIQSVPAPESANPPLASPLAFRKLAQYAKVGFVITETEMRAAIEGDDSYLQYCQAKMPATKPDLYLMLLNCWRGVGVAPSTLAASAIPGAGTGNSSPGAELKSNTAHQVGNTSNAGSVGQPTILKGGQDTKLSRIDLTISVHPGFLADLHILCDFIRDIANKYYGQQYMVKLPLLVSYRDYDYYQLNMQGFFPGTSIPILAGTGKLHQAYDPVDGAWEEYGNYIDNDILVGSPQWKILSDEKGLIQPILGFNVSDKIDYVRKAWCMQTVAEAAKKLSALRKRAVSLAGSIDDSSILVPNKPLSGNLAKWVLRTKTGAVLTGAETDEEMIYRIGIDGASFGIYKKFQEITKQASAIMSSLPARLDCKAEEELIEAAPNTPGAEPDTNVSVSIYVNENQFLIPSINYGKLDADGKNYVIVPTTPFSDAFGGPVCGGGKKLYMRANWGNNTQFAYGNPSTLSDPRAILTINNRIELAKNSLAYKQEPNEFVMPNVAAEDVSYYRYSKAAGNKHLTKTNVKTGEGADLSADEYARLEYLESKFLTPLKHVDVEPSILLDSGSESNISTQHQRITPKAAQPFFAAVPLKSNKFTYGPWVNYPDLVKDYVFSYLQNKRKAIENLTDNVEVKHNADYVPWQYGGVSLLDAAVLYDIRASENYQVIEEKGSVKIVGSPVFAIGSRFYGDATLRSVFQPVTFEPITVTDYPEQTEFNSATYTYNIPQLEDINLNANLSTIPAASIPLYRASPIVQGVNISVGIDGINTTYSFGTYNPKHGLYNKERIDQMKDINQNILNLYTTLTQGANRSNEQFRNEIYKIINDTTRYGERKDYSLPESMFGNSPSELLIGQGRHFLPDPGPPLDGGKPKFLTDLNSSNIASGMIDRGYRHEVWNGLFMANEVGPEIVKDYRNKAAMSLDGIFSPISFYPTLYDSTYPISNHLTAKFLISNSGEKNKYACSVCNNTRVIEDIYVDYSTTQQTRSTVKYPCPSCSHSRLSLIKGSGNPTDKIRRVTIDPKSKSAEINFYTLNPIVVSTGEFQNYNAQSGILETHSIRVVARGESIPADDASLDTHRNVTYSKDTINPDYESYDSAASIMFGPDKLYALNQRFFGLRGPLMLHGWGYDTEGYPVPNASDDPLEIDQYGRHKRFQLDNNGFNDLNAPGLFVPPDGSDKPLGDIITQRYEFKGNKWVAKGSLSKYFGANWARKPNSWPVGPIDLRWDHDRRVWVSTGCGEEKLPPYIVTNSTDLSTITEFLNQKPKQNCPYKMIYITLEQDLTREDNLYYYSNITRGYIDDLEYKSEQLSNGYRRLVYIIDRSGYTAPAGTRLYCRYNADLGYYEPITKPTVITTGVIIGNQARIDLIYAKGKLSNSTPNTLVNFSNPLEFYISESAKGIFSYIDGSWTLTAIN